MSPCRDCEYSYLSINGRRCRPLKMLVEYCLTKPCEVAKVVFLACMLVSCKSVEYIPVEVVQTDTLIITKHTRDSIFVQDSTHVNEQQHGDTITLTITKWRTKYIERTVHDTCYIATHDTIPKPCPQEVEVPAELTNWQRFKIGMGEALIYIIIGVVVWLILKHKAP